MPRPPRRPDPHPAQLSLPVPQKPRARPTPEQLAKAYIARRAKRSVVPGHVKLTLTLELERVLAERLSAMAIRDDKNVEAVVIELLAKASR